MGGIISRPKIPAPPPPPAPSPAPTRSDAEIAAEEARKQAALRRGRASTIVSPRGAGILAESAETTGTINLLGSTKS